MMREVALLETLDHPFITRIHESFTENGALHIIMEYCDGGTLQGLLKQMKEEGGKLDEGQIVSWFVQLILALQYTHSKRILHRDLKTENVFLHEGNIKLGDFGLARALSSQSKFAATLVGTPYYLSPELCLGRRYNEKSDIWSLGCILYEMIAHRPPFLAKNLAALVFLITDQPYDALPAGICSDELVRLIAEMLKKQPNARTTLEDLVASSPLLQQYLAAVHSQYPSLGPADAAAAVAAVVAAADASAGSSAGGAEKVGAVQPLEGCHLYHWGNSSVPRLVEPLIEIDVRHMDVGGTGEKVHFGIVTSTELLYTWGAGHAGQLGQESRADSKLPRLVMTGVHEVHCGMEHTAALTNDGEVWTFGSGDEGQLGTAQTVSLTPEAVEDLIGKTMVGLASGDFHVLAWTDDGKLYAWGQNDAGQLGIGSTDVSPRPVLVGGALEGHKVVGASAGSDWSMAVTEDGNVFVWGSNEYGKLGLGSEDDEDAPVKAASLSGQGVVRVSAGANHGLALTRDGTVLAWGDNVKGQLGSKANGRSAPAPVGTLPSEAHFTAIAAGTAHSLAICDSGDIYAWGTAKYGAAGEGVLFTGQDKYLPTVVDEGMAAGDRHAKQIAVSAWHSLALL